MLSGLVLLTLNLIEKINYYFCTCTLFKTEKINKLENTKFKIEIRRGKGRGRGRERVTEKENWTILGIVYL